MGNRKVKNEVSRFRTKYFDKNTGIYLMSLSNGQQGIEKVIDILKRSKDFERPDGYYFEHESLTLYIFEHFEFDCSPRIGNGSSLRRNSQEANNSIEQEIANSGEEYNSVKVIVQGYSKEDDETTFVMGADGDKYRDNYIAHFTKAYNDHAVKIQKYIDNCKKEIGIMPQKVVTSFLIEDVTVFGTHFKKGNGMGDPVVLTYTKQFIEVFQSSIVDYVFFGSSNDGYLIICDRSIANDDLSKYIDLLNEEFYIIPAAPLYTAAIKH